jgi:tight adherence protein C
MPALALILGLMAVGVAIGLGVYLLAANKMAPAGMALADGGLPVVAKPEKVDDPFEMTSLLRRLGSLAASLSPSDYTARVQRRLNLAGNPRSWSPERLMAFKGLGLVAGVVLGFVLGVKHGFGPTVLFTAGAAAVGLFLPDILVRNIGEKRQLDLQKALPDTIDMLTVCVEAGLGFDSALARVARNTSGPLAEEFARVLQEMQIGMSRAEALRALVSRTNVTELRAFVSAMVQSGELGISIGDVLREQSREMRIRRRQRAEEKAQKLQVKLLAPLILCLLPAMFIVILGPAVMNIMNFFSKANG